MIIVQDIVNREHFSLLRLVFGIERYCGEVSLLVEGVVNTREACSLDLDSVWD